MDVNLPLPLLGGLSASVFMRRHWQKRPLLVRQAWPGVQPPLTRAQAFALVAQDDVESRLVQRSGQHWQMRSGPLARRALPALSQPGWTLLLQGLDLHVSAARRMLDSFRFVPDARLDDLMLSWASDAGGVGPHTDAYDVFLLQVQGRRRWQVGRVAQPLWAVDAPLKRLLNFKPTLDWVLEPGDMLYLPPHWGHDGVAVGGDCMTCSIGFRSPERDELADELLVRLADSERPQSPDEDDVDDEGRSSQQRGPERQPGTAPKKAPKAPKTHYRDPQQPATAHPAQLPADLLHFARQALTRRLAQPGAIERALGEWASEPKPQVWFEPGGSWPPRGGLKLDPRTRMLYDKRHVYINGESLRASGRDARLMQQLADQRSLAAEALSALSAGAAVVLAQWVAAGWAHELGEAGARF